MVFCVYDSNIRSWCALKCVCLSVNHTLKFSSAEIFVKMKSRARQKKTTLLVDTHSHARIYTHNVYEKFSNADQFHIFTLRYWCLFLFSMSYVMLGILCDAGLWQWIVEHSVCLDSFAHLVWECWAISYMRTTYVCLFAVDVNFCCSSLSLTHCSFEIAFF